MYCGEKCIKVEVKVMFGGVSNLSLDPKGRIAIPAKYREMLADGYNRLVITLESAQCLLLYPELNWDNVRDKIQQLPTGSHPLVKSYQRLVLGYAETIEMDKTGRILLPQALRNMVKLEKDLVLVGMGNRFELWDNAKWLIETEKALSASSEDLASL